MNRFLAVVVACLALFTLTCKREDSLVGPGNQSDGRISIINDEAALSARVTYFSNQIPVDSIGVGLPKGTGIQAFSLVLRAEVSPPSIGGQVLQATSVVIKGNRAIVSYNMRGAQYLGGVDVIDISNKSNPRLKSQALFQNADMNAVTFDASYVYASEATGDTGFPYPAVLEIIRLQGDNLILGGSRLWLTSFAGTGAFVSGTKIYATSGDGGRLSAFNVSTLLPTDSINLHDARWVDVAGGKVVVVQGTPGQISVFSEANLAPLGTFPFTGANVSESKSTVQVIGGKAFIAAGPGGVQILSATTGLVVGSVARPNPDSLGLADSVVVTNAASVDQDLLFISNGEAGVYVAQGSVPFANTGSEVQQQITTLGRLRFSNLQSVNHVEYKSGYLIIAAGLGGLKLVEVVP